jgi:hypothetical protein
MKWLLSVKNIPAYTVTFSLVKGSKTTRDSMTSLVVEIIIKKNACKLYITFHIYVWRECSSGIMNRLFCTSEELTVAFRLLAQSPLKSHSDVVNNKQTKD